MKLRPAFAAFFVLPVALATQAAWALPQVQVHGPRAHAAAASDLDAVLGTYVLSNGQTLNLSGRHPRFLARVGDAQAVALEATAPNTYESADGSLRLQVQPQANGVVTDLKLSYRP